VNSASNSAIMGEEAGSGSGRHVMISYNWGYQETAKSVAELLKQHGINTWMDIDGGMQRGDINIAMAQGVENAYALVCLVSEKYQHSKNCRRELSYADIKNLPILPVMVDPGYDGEDWLGIILAGLLYYDFRGEDMRQSAEQGFIDAVKSIYHDTKDDQKDSKLAKQKEIFNRDFAGRVYQKEGRPVQYGFEAFDKIWIDHSKIKGQRSCIKKDGSMLSSDEVGREYFRDVEFVADRTFVGTIYFDNPNYWSISTGPNGKNRYSFVLSPDLSRIESGKVMAIDANGDVVNYTVYGKESMRENTVDENGNIKAGEMKYVLHEILNLPQKSTEGKSEGSGVQASGPINTKPTGSGGSSVVVSSGGGTVTISKTEYDELKDYKEKFFHLKGLLKIASSYCDNS